MHLKLSTQTLYTRGGLLDQLMDVAFESAMLVDPACTIIYSSKGSSKLLGVRHGDLAGQPVKDAPTRRLFQRVLHTGKALIGEMVSLYGRKCVTNIFPIYNEEAEIIGAFSYTLYQNLSHLKEVLSSLQKSALSQVHDINDAVARLESSYTFRDYIGKSAATLEMLRLCQRASATPHPVLLLGETGTGKELLSHAIHNAHTPDALTPFIKINCTAIPNDLLESELFGHERGAFTGAMALKKGKFELAAGGSILLDEIGDMDLRLQGKLLRVLEEREFERVGGNTLIRLNARIIASTNRDLHKLCREGRFRLDLYYRLNALEIKIPPLRERKEDIPLIVEHFIRENNQPMVLSSEAMALLLQYDWPGNIRELKNLILRIGIISDKVCIDSSDLQKYLPAESAKPLGAGAFHNASEDKGEKERMEAVLKACQYNLSKAARELSISRATLYSRIRRYGVTVARSLSS